MTLEIVKKFKGDPPEPTGRLSPLEEDALRAVRRDEADDTAREIYRQAATRLRDEERWLLCDCRDGAVIAFSLRGSGIVTVNRPDAPVPHAPDCPFGLRDAGDDADAAALAADLFLQDARAAPGEGPGDGVERPWRGGRPSSLSQVLKTTMRGAGLDRFDGAGGAAAPTDWLADYRRAAREVRVAGGVRMSDILFTDPATWAAGRVPDALDAIARVWPGRGRPFVLLSWLARDVAAHRINPKHPEAGLVEVQSRVARPAVGHYHIGGPFLFLGIVACGKDGEDSACHAASVQPILSPEIPMPVDSDNERRALAALRGAIAGLARDTALAGAPGGPARVVLEKPLFPLVVDGRPCLPDAILTVARPGGGERQAADPDGPLAEGPFAGRGTARYVIEVMGSTDPAYERRKEITHARMRRIGRVIRMEAKQFDSSWYDLETQTRTIARRIKGDLLARWQPE